MASFMLLASAVPLLMIFALLAFMTEEMWEVFSRIADPDLIAVGVLFVGLGTASSSRGCRRRCGGSRRRRARATPLGKRQRRNVGLVLFTSQARPGADRQPDGRASSSSSSACSRSTRRSGRRGSATAGDVLLEFDLFGEPFEITEELLKVAAGLAAFTGLYFAIAMLTDSTYREEFLEEVTAELRSVFRVREEYLRLRAGAPPADGSRHDPRPRARLRARPGNHCGSTALRNLLAFHGAEISEEIAFGLGAGPCFYYFTVDGDVALALHQRPHRRVWRRASWS